MSWEQKNAYNNFISHIKILKCRVNEKARSLNDEEAKRETEEYDNICKILEKIYKGKFLARVSEKNEDKKLYEQISKMAYVSYNKIKREGYGYEDSEDELNNLYYKVQLMLRDYKIDKTENSKKEQTNKGIER